MCLEKENCFSNSYSAKSLMENTGCIYETLMENTGCIYETSKKKTNV